MDNWKEEISSEYIDLISGFAFKSKNFHSEQIEGTLPVIKIKNVANGDVNFDSVVYHHFDESLEKYELSKGDVLIAMTGNHPQAKSQVVGDVSKYKLDSKSLLNQRVGKIVAKENANLDFIYYLFKNKETHNYLANQSSGSANQANISKKNILSLELNFPPLPEQKTIAQVLSSLDDKIDLLHRQNKTLEAMAETLFRQWFVEEADESWEEGTLGDFGTVITGKTPSRKNPEHWGESFDFITPTDFKFFGMFTDRTGRKLSNDGWNRFLNIQLPVNSILVTCIGSDMGKVAISSNSCITNQQLNSIIINDVCNLGYVYQHIKSKYNEIRSIAFGGTTMPIINKGDFSQIDIPIPPKNVIDKFQSYWSSLSDRIRFNQKQIQSLTNLRDTLLPKLMSGEVRVSESRIFTD